MKHYAEYGNVFVEGKDAARARGSGNWNPPPMWEQSTNRGPAQQKSWPMYLNENEKVDGTILAPQAINVFHSDSAIFPTAQNEMDDIRKRAYKVGSTGFHAEQPNSWTRPEFEGNDNQYVVWALRSLNLQPNVLLNYFFHTDNVHHLQKRTIDEIKRIRNVDIKPQSVDELLIIMRNKYAYAQSGWLKREGAADDAVFMRGPAPCSIEFKLTRLNKAVIEETVKQVLSGIDQYKQYIKDQSSLPMPLEHPTLTTMKGSKVLSESIGFNSAHERTIGADSYNERYNIL